MSGGTFDYDEQRMGYITERIEELLNDDFKRRDDGGRRTTDRLEGASPAEREEIKDEARQLVWMLNHLKNRVRALDRLLAYDHGIESYLEVMRAERERKCPDQHTPKTTKNRWPMGKEKALRKVALWALGRDTGVSSMAIARGYLAGCPKHWHEMPSDADDFGRCYRLVKLIPPCREGITVNAKSGDAWRSLHEGWDKLCAMYEAVNMDELNGTLRLMNSR